MPPKKPKEKAKLTPKDKVEPAASGSHPASKYSLHKKEMEQTQQAYQTEYDLQRAAGVSEKEAAAKAEEARQQTKRKLQDGKAAAAAGKRQASAAASGSGQPPRSTDAEPEETADQAAKEPEKARAEETADQAAKEPEKADDADAAGDDGNTPTDDTQRQAAQPAAKAKAKGKAKANPKATKPKQQGPGLKPKGNLKERAAGNSEIAKWRWNCRC